MNKIEKERKGYKFPLIIPNKEIDEQLSQYVGCCRFVYNKALDVVKADDDKAIKAKEEGKDYTREYKFNPGYQLSKLLPEWKKEKHFLKDAYSEALQNSILHLGKAVANGKDRIQKYPVHKKKGIHDSFSYNNAEPLRKAMEGVKSSRVWIPKIGWLSYKQHREVVGTIKNITISRQCGQWYVSLQTEKDYSYEEIKNTEILAIDRGVKNVVACNRDIEFEFENKIISGKQINSINARERYENKLKKAQQKLTTKGKYSNNWKKCKQKIAKIHHKIANRRKDFVHKLSRGMVNEYAYVKIEDLKVNNMTKSAKGTVENPGKGVKAKSGLNKSILDQGWGKLKECLDYKLKCKYNTELGLVDPKYTSQQCSKCGYIDKGNRNKQADFVCKKCGYTENADINASYNIANRSTLGARGIA